MLRLLLGANGSVLRSIVSKYISKIFKDNGLKTRVNTKDFVVYKEGDDLLVHLSADFKVNEKDLLDFLNGKLDVAE